MKRGLISVLPIIFLITASCKKNHTVSYNVVQIGLPYNAAGSVVHIDSFPLHVGNQWTYKMISQTITQTTGQYSAKITYPDTVTLLLTAISDTTIYNTRYTKLSTDPSNSHFFTFQNDNCYYSNLSGGTYQYQDLN